MNPPFAILSFGALAFMLASVAGGSGHEALNVTLPNWLCADEVGAVGQAGSDHTDLMHLAVCLHRESHPAAIDLYKYIRRTTPDFSYVLVNLAIMSLKSGDLENARRLLQQYLMEVGGPYGEEPPTDRSAKDQGPPCRPNAPGNVDCVNALNNLGALELTDGRNMSAATFYLSRAAEVGVESTLANVYANLGGASAKLGDHEGAADAFVRGFWVSLRQGSLEAAVGMLVRRAFLVPTVASSVEETEQTRIRFGRRISDISSLARNGGSSWLGDESDLFRVATGISAVGDILQIPRLSGVLHSWTTNVQLPPFYVHYYGWHDLPLNTAVADMFALLCPPSLFEVAGHLANIDRVRSTQSHAINVQKKRVGFVSSLIGGDEPHGLLVLDIIRSLKRLFDFYVVSIGSKPLSNEFLQHASGGVFAVGYDEVQARQVLSSLQLDCLVFAESMNDPIVHFLGYQRFAAIQILVQGSPVTSGIPTFDYFVSGDLLEHPFRTQLSDDHYSEQLVLFDGQAISFPREQFHPLQDSTLAAGDAVALSNMTALERMDDMRGRGGHIYLCFQSIQKMQPSFDHILVDIINGDPRAQLVLQASRSSIQTKSLQRRLQSVLKERLCNNEYTECPSMVDALSRIYFLPRVKSDEVLDLMRKSDVVLHPFPFGGSKTASDAINAGVPLITYPQSYLRGRMASVFFKMMALGKVDPDVPSCCVAKSVSDYVSKALRLASDPDYRSRVARAIQEQSDRIFNEKMISVEWGKLLTRSLGVHMDDKELAAQIGFLPEERHQEAYLSKMVVDEQLRWRKGVLLGNLLDAK